MTLIESSLLNAKVAAEEAARNALKYKKNPVIAATNAATPIVAEFMEKITYAPEAVKANAATGLVANIATGATRNAREGIKTVPKSRPDSRYSHRAPRYTD